MSEDDRQLESWLRRMKWALASLPESERDDIIAETNAHITERVAEGTPLRVILAEFEAPETYARHFVDDREILGAIGSQRSGAMLAVVVRRVHRSVVAAAALLITVGLAAIAFAATLTAIVKIADPVHAGLWSSKTQLFLGVINDPGATRELLGNWIYVLAILSVALAVIVGRAVLILAVRTLARTR